MATVWNSFEGEHPDSFHSSMQPLLVLAQFCGLVPIKGISDPPLKFTWVNGLHLYALMVSAVTLFFDTCYTIDNFNIGIRIDVFASTVFYTVCLLTTYFFLGIAKELPGISRSFAEVESHMKDYGYPKWLGLKIKLFLIVFIFLAMIEHGALVFINVKFAWNNAGNDGNGFGYFFYVSHFPSVGFVTCKSKITKRLSYSAMGTIILFWVNATCTFNWNYLDFFIIVISMETYSRFQLINERLKSVSVESESRAFWDKIRQDYNRLSLLTKNLDKKLSRVILTSFFSNMYHLSLQLVRSLKISGSLFQMTYFYFSLTYLIVRLLLVLFFAAKVNDESKKPESHFPLEDPSPEAFRFWHQVHTDDVALTGNRFFVINNKFVVSIVGTILTYQGVLLQFNSLQGEIPY